MEGVTSRRNFLKTPETFGSEENKNRVRADVGRPGKVANCQEASEELVDLRCKPTLAKEALKTEITIS